ncbi:isoprenylcysteine carboxylmethyltransferase family protein [Caldilinea sp.]|uniref:methyltransferase family protein n=1 Tax=Caldilinea sp. TaxID=2293560 RepID=UPI002C469E97|nr:isoprenylcysteine carboxylmethyltransferase family protein [Caldilinea sp.]
MSPARILIGAMLIVAGIGLVVLARSEFARCNQPTDPGRATSEIITTGVFSISRNPLYLGGILLLAGLALSLNAPWALMLLLPSLVACHFILIAPEERYLVAKFGEPYRQYTESVHRWIGRS